VVTPVVVDLLAAGTRTGGPLLPAELPASHFECCEGNQAVDGAGAGAGDLVEDGEKNNDLPAGS
jgi:hypothetical protein